MADPPPIELQVITPEGPVLRVQVDELTAPSVEGDFGVLAGHRPLIAALRTGIVTYRKGTQEDRVAVGPGFVEIANDCALVLTSSFCRPDDVDVIVARQELVEADDALQAFSGTLGGPEHGVLLRRERWAATRLELCGEPPPPSVYTVLEFQTVAHGDYSAEATEKSEASAPGQSS
jgi:F-type H+-transporting ATPase subunit epsilon